MDNLKQEQEWQKLQEHIIQMFNKYFSSVSSTDLIEWKPQHQVYLLSMSQDDRKNRQDSLEAK